MNYGGVTSGTTTGPGNLTTLRGSSQTFNADNQLSGADYAYDGNGNPATYKAISLTFDPENRLTGYGSALTAGYNGDGLRAWKQNSSGRTYFLYDGEQPVCELNSSGSVTATNTFGTNGLVSRHSGGSSVFYVFDLRGCLAERVNSSGGVLSTHYMDANGGGPNEVSSDPWSGPWSQWGGYTDMETGWTLCSHRYYVGQGRWLTRDPDGYDGGVNLYGYCGNDPVDRNDEDGMKARPAVGCSTAAKAALQQAINSAINDITKSKATPKPLGLPNDIGHSITPDERKCLLRLLSSNITIDCGGPGCPGNDGYKKPDDPGSVNVKLQNCHVHVCLENINSDDLDNGIKSVSEQITETLIHELLHCCGRPDDGGPVVKGIPTNPADNGARYCVGAHGYGYGE